MIWKSSRNPYWHNSVLCTILVTASCTIVMTDRSDQPWNNRIYVSVFKELKKSCPVVFFGEWEIKARFAPSVAFRVPRQWYLVRAFPQSRKTVGHIGPRQPVSFSDSSLRRSWNKTRRRLGLGPYRTVGYPLLTVRQTRAYGGANPDAQGASSGGWGLERSVSYGLLLRLGGQLYLLCHITS